MGRAKKNWIQGALKNVTSGKTRGKLHDELGVARDKKIPMRELEKAAHSDDPLEAKRARLAKTLRGFRRGR
jgi:hypothetical protein